MFWQLQNWKNWDLNPRFLDFKCFLKTHFYLNIQKPLLRDFKRLSTVVFCLENKDQSRNSVCFSESKMLPDRILPLFDREILLWTLKPRQKGIWKKKKIKKWTLTRLLISLEFFIKIVDFRLTLLYYVVFLLKLGQVKLLSTVVCLPRL